jgi:zinc protease
MKMPDRIQPPLFQFDNRVSTEVTSVRLKNGIPVFMLEAGTEEIMRIEFVFRAGSSQEYIPLLASSTNMMLTEGTENFNSEELNNILDYYGIFLNLSAEKDSAGMIMYFLKKQVKKALELAAEILFRPVFPAREFSVLMNKRLRWYLINREKVQNIATDELLESVFGSRHPYGRQAKEEDFNNLIPPVLMDFHSKFYTPENLGIIISGRIHDKTTELLNKYFGEFHPVNNYIEETNNHLLGKPGMKVRIEKQGAIQTAIRIGSSTIKKTDPDYPGLKFLNTLLGGYFGSRLMKNIREEKGYTYGIHSSVSSFRESGLLVISTEVGTEYTEKTVDEIYREISRLQIEPVKNEEIQVVRNYISGELLRMFNGPFALAESFKAVWQFGLDLTYYNIFAEKLDTISQDEIIRLANAYYNIDKLYEVIAG